MEIIGAIALIVLGIIVILHFVKTNQEDVEATKKKVTFLMEHSKFFKDSMNNEKIDIWGAVDDKFGYDGKRLRKIIGEISKNNDAQQEIRKSIDFSTKCKLMVKEHNQKRNYIAFQNLDIIKMLKQLKPRFNKLEIFQAIETMQPNENLESKLEELLSNGIIEIDKNENYLLGNITSFIHHPYHLGEDGNPKHIFL